MKSGYNHIKDTFQNIDTGYNSDYWNRGINFRKRKSVERIDKPTKLYRARELGYKAKQGYIIVRSRIRKGTRRKSRPRMGRKPRSLGVSKITPKKNLQRIAEERAQKKYTNLEVLNSYKIYDDGRHWYYEVIFVDPNHPRIKSDPNIKWICETHHKRRVNRGLTSAGKRGRGLHKKGWGTEKNRPSIRANKNRGK